MIDFYDKSLWQNDNKHWLNKRKHDWKCIRLVLENMQAGRPPQRNLKYHKEEYFLLGKIPSEYLGLFYRLWYYPGDLNKILDQLWGDFNIRTNEIDNTRQIFLNDISRLGVGDSDAVYGYLGGREKLLARFFVPSKYSEDMVERLYKKYRVSPWPADSFLEVACERLHHFVGAAGAKVSTNPFQTFQYLLDHFFSCFRFLDDNIPGSVEHPFTWLLEEVNKFHCSEEDTILAKNANKFVKKFIARLESDEATDYVKTKWLSVKQSIA